MTQVVTLHLPVGAEFALGLKGERRIHSKISQNPRAMNQRLFPMQLKETFPTIGISTGHHGLTHFIAHGFFQRMSICMQWYVECSHLSSFPRTKCLVGQHCIRNSRRNGEGREKIHFEVWGVDSSASFTV